MVVRVSYEGRVVGGVLGRVGSAVGLFAKGRGEWLGSVRFG